MKNTIVSVLLCTAVVGPAFGCEKLTVLTEDWPPFNFKEDRQIVGISTDLVIATLKRAELEYVLELKPWKRAYQNTPCVRIVVTSDESVHRWGSPGLSQR